MDTAVPEMFGKQERTEWPGKERRWTEMGCAHQELRLVRGQRDGLWRTEEPAAALKFPSKIQICIVLSETGIVEKRL